MTELTAEDMAGPVPSVAVITTNYYLVLAWVFTLTTASWHVSKSRWLTWAVESVRNAWREAEIQHECTDIHSADMFNLFSIKLLNTCRRDNQLCQCQ